MDLGDASNSSALTMLEWPFILVPLYIYPTSTSWSSLFSAARSHPGLQFIAVVNPNNGPGSAPSPDINYTAALRELSTLSNIRILGYIFCSYGERALVEMERDILVYYGWTARRGCGSGLPVDRDQTTTQTIRMDGVFFDEAPSASEHVNYMAHISKAARKTLQNAESTIIIYNPGIFVDQAFYESADYVAVFENRAAAWDSPYVCANLAMLPESLRGRSVAISHSAGCVNEQLQFARDVVTTAGFAGHFATAASGYTQWCSNWWAYVQQASEMCRGNLTKP